MHVHQWKFLPFIWKAAGAASLLLVAVLPCRADSSLAGDQANPPASSAIGNYFSDWFTRVSKTQAEQPHWITPLATVTPRLEEELRYDQDWQHLPGGKTLMSDGGGKGLELIPAGPIEIILGVPAWQSESSASGVPIKHGWADDTFLLKYRLLTANEDKGDYIVTAFLGLSVPSGSSDLTLKHYVVTPTIAFGKGWGDFDFQTTCGVGIPDNGGAPKGAGTPLALNNAFQYRVDKNIWPELEVNYTYYPNGEHETLNQVFLTPGVIVGRIPLVSRLGLTFGAGYQIAVTEHPIYRHNLILTVRLPF